MNIATSSEQPTPTPPVPHALIRLSDEIDRLQSVCNDLEGRLAPSLAPEEAEPAAVETDLKPGAPLCGLVLETQGLTYRLKVLIDRLNTLYARCQL